MPSPASMTSRSERIGIVTGVGSQRPTTEGSRYESASQPASRGARTGEQARGGAGGAGPGKQRLDARTIGRSQRSLRRGRRRGGLSSGPADVPEKTGFRSDPAAVRGLRLRAIGQKRPFASANAVARTLNVVGGPRDRSARAADRRPAEAEPPTVRGLGWTRSGAGQEQVGNSRLGPLDGLSRGGWLEVPPSGGSSAQGLGNVHESSSRLGPAGPPVAPRPRRGRR